MEGGLDVGLWEHDPPTNWENSDTHPGYNEKISKKHLKCISRASVSHYKVHVALDLTARPSAATPAKATAQHCGPSMPPRQPSSWEVDGSSLLRFRAREALPLMQGALPKFV